MKKENQNLPRPRPRRAPGQLGPALQQRPHGLSISTKIPAPPQSSSPPRFPRRHAIPTTSAKNSAAHSRTDEANLRLRHYQGEKKLPLRPINLRPAPRPHCSKRRQLEILDRKATPFLDATFWTDDELIKTGRSKKTAREIGHISALRPQGLLGTLPAGKGRRILIHINNTNPILDEDSREHRAVLDAGFEIAYDGMEFEL